jgi:hypothetical protein
MHHPQQQEVTVVDSVTVNQLQGGAGNTSMLGLKGWYEGQGEQEAGTAAGSLFPAQPTTFAQIKPIPISEWAKCHSCAKDGS